MNRPHLRVSRKGDEGETSVRGVGYQSFVCLVLFDWLAWHSFFLSQALSPFLSVGLSQPFSRSGSCRALPQHMTYTQLLDRSRPQHKLTCQIPKKTREAVSSQRTAFQHLICNAPKRTAGEAGGEAGGSQRLREWQSEKPIPNTTKRKQATKVLRDWTHKRTHQGRTDMLL